MAKVQAKPNTRGNGALRAQALALSMHAWNNTVQDWQNLEEAVTRLGASAPKAAVNALASHKRSMQVLANPWKS